MSLLCYTGNCPNDNFRCCRCWQFDNFTSFNVIDLSPPSAACMRQWMGSALVQIMACRLFGAKPSPEPMLAYCRLDSRNKLQWIWIEILSFPFKKMYLKVSSARMAAILSRGGGGGSKRMDDKDPMIPHSQCHDLPGSVRRRESSAIWLWNSSRWIFWGCSIRKKDAAKG